MLPCLLERVVCSVRLGDSSIFCTLSTDLGPVNSVPLTYEGSYTFGFPELSHIEETCRSDFSCYELITGPKEPSLAVN